jgi:hypothetical protein
MPSIAPHFPTDHKFVFEIRNKTWLDARLADVFREHNVALALTDTSFVPRRWEVKGQFDMITADFVYVRWLLFKYVEGQFTLLSKPFKTKAKAEKARLKLPERLGLV